jgi:trehalose 6-phosphate synthase
MHTPWAPPDYFAVLPDDIAEALIRGVLGADSSGFLTARWAEAFRACAEQIPGVSVDGTVVTLGGRSTSVKVHALGVDAPHLQARAAEADVEDRLEKLTAWAGGRKVIVRIDRTELSKNIVRGLLAYRDVLRHHPELRGDVVHLVFAYPSREDLPEYRAYTASVRRTAQAINDEFGTDEWSPIQLQLSDDYARSLAAMRLADVLVVNPTRDGMNLVAKEGPILSDAGVALVLSREAGAAAELARDAFVVNPYDVSATADAIYAGLTMDPAKRLWRSERLAHAASARTPQQWFADQIADLG